MPSPLLVADQQQFASLCTSIYASVKAALLPNAQECDATKVQFIFYCPAQNDLLYSSTKLKRFCSTFGIREKNYGKKEN